MNNKTEKHLNWLVGSPEGNRQLEKYAEEFAVKLLTEKLDYQRYFNSEEFARLIKIIKTHLEKTHKQLRDPVMGDIVIEGVSLGQFCYLFEVIFYAFGDKSFSVSKIDGCDDFYWSNESAIYDGMVFTRIYGQGTAYEVALKKDSRFKNWRLNCKK